MTAKHSFADVKSDLETMLGAERVQQVGATRVDDHARIASLLTDEDACRVYLARLNSELVTRCRARNMIGKFFGFERKSLTTTRYQHPAKPDETAEVVKHNKVFTDFFRQWEDAAGFNQGVQQIEGGMPLAPKTINLPAGPGRDATLTEFVEPNDFRKYLLKHGYHWKDAGVGGRHGEFTHRIHWYIIVEYARANPNRLTHTPIDLFKTCGESSTVVKSGWTVWDYGRRASELAPASSMRIRKRTVARRVLIPSGH